MTYVVGDLLRVVMAAMDFGAGITDVQRPKPPETKMTQPQYILTKNTLTLMADGSIHTVDNTHQKWDRILQLIKDGKWEEVLDIVQIRDRIAGFIAGTDNITIENDEVKFNGEVLHNALCTRLVEMYYEGFDIQPMLNFLSNMMKNTSYTAIEGLYNFLESNSLPITPDGCFLAYKRIKADWTDCHSGTIDNSVGKTVSMPRVKVEDNPSKDCAPGLHVCSLDYLKNFNGEKIIACKVNPADVVSVPTHYNHSKMRVCRYEVVQQLSMKLVGGEDDAWDEPVVDPNDNLDETDSEKSWGQHDERVEDPRYED